MKMVELYPYAALLLFVYQLTTIQAFSSWLPIPRRRLINSPLPRLPSVQRFGKARGGSSPPLTPANEFSRTLPPERIRAHTSQQGRQQGRDYQLSIEATATECQALARRFDLKHISALQASVAVRAEPNAAVQVEGRVVASVTQTCVRTNEDFPVQVEFPLFALVRPVVPLFAATSSSSAVDLSDGDKWQQKQSTTTPKRRKSVSYKSGGGGGATLSDLDLMEMQRLLQEDIMLEDEDSALMEDEAIYPVGGQIDIGELVSQLFWLNLDPYPKKPGTGPIQTTITG